MNGEVQEEAEKSDLADLFVRQKRNFWDPVPLTVDRSLRFARVLGWMLFDAAFVSKDAESADTKSLIMQLTELLDADRLVMLLSIVVDEPEEAIRKQWHLVSALQSLIAFWEAEDLGELFSLAAKLAQPSA